MHEFKKIADWKFWVLMPVFGLLIPFAIKELTGNLKTLGVIISLFIINIIFSVFVGIYLRRHGSFWYLLIIWPLIFCLGVVLNLFPDAYGYYFGIVYLIIELYAYTMGQESEVDIDDQIPIDGGIKEVK